MKNQCPFFRRTNGFVVPFSKLCIRDVWDVLEVPVAKPPPHPFGVEHHLWGLVTGGSGRGVRQAALLRGALQF